jgi:hypothetical protein
VGLLLSVLVTAMLPGVVVAKDKSKTVCKDGGWTELVDENGQPFTSEQDCTGFAKAGGTPQPPAPPLPECTILGTDGDNSRMFVNSGEVFCGLGGNDSVDQIEAGGVFIGGEGNDSGNYTYGAFYGEGGDDSLYELGHPFLTTPPLFDGGAGNDSLQNARFGTTTSVETIVNDQR